MHKFILWLALLAGCLLCPDLALAQRSQALCKDAVANTAEGRVDGINCTSLEGRIYAITDLDGLEEDAIIGIGSADITLTRAQITDLATTRVVLATAPGVGKHYFIDWVVIIKTDTDGADSGNIGIGVTVATESGGQLEPRITIYAQAVGFGAGFFTAGPHIGRYSPTAVGVAESTTEDTPIVVGVNGTEANWSAVVAQLDTSVTLRIIVRYRIIDTTATF